MKHRSIDLLLVIGIFLAYSIATAVALNVGLTRSVLGGIANTVPIVICGLGIRTTVWRLIEKPLPVQLAVHLILCAVFCALAYYLLIVLLGLFNTSSPNGFEFSPFPTSGTAWQSLENVTTYAFIAALAHLQVTNSRRQVWGMKGLAPQDAQIAYAAGGTSSNTEKEGPVPAFPAIHRVPGSDRQPKAVTGSEEGPSRYFVKVRDELRPIDLDTVVSINGADDYAELSTTTGKHLVRMTLSSFVKALDASKYVRVHRSWIVNIDRVTRAESAGGGRLLLHMESGQTISTSRNGARLFRSRIL